MTQKSKNKYLDYTHKSNYLDYMYMNTRVDHSVLVHVESYVSEIPVL